MKANSIRRIILAAFLMLAIFWFSSLVKYEYLTVCYGDQFTNAYSEHTMLATPDYLKVLSYTDSSAKVYYVKRGAGGNILTFVRSDNQSEWQFAEWITVWSETGSASDFVWPYIR